MIFNHTRGAIVTVFPDGRVVFGLTTLPDDMSPEQAGRLGGDGRMCGLMLDQLTRWQAGRTLVFGR
ncbi:MAG: hypothetical protein H6661_07875 [Ardenticatenaceae bacterium]|nr:hypothetical protein [Ardenticatenaceae bacterium]